MKKLGIISVLLGASSLFTITSNAANDVIIKQFEGTLFQLSTCFPKVNRPKVTRAEKQAMRKKLPEIAGLACDGVYQNMQGNLQPQLLQLLENIKDHYNAEYQEQIIAHYPYMLNRLVSLKSDKLTRALTFDCTNFADVASEDSISYDYFTKIVIEHTVLCLGRIQQEVNLGAQNPEALFNTLCNQGMIHITINTIVSMAFQRWLEHDFNEQQWHELLDAQYYALANILPSSCGSFSPAMN